jgi:uncharacterized membrane-anchored protein
MAKCQNLMGFVILSLACGLFLVSPPSGAKDETQTSAPKVTIDWIDGPVTRLGDIAQIKIPEGYRFTGKEGTRKFLELTQNPPGGNELGTIIRTVSPTNQKEQFWFVMFEFSEVGYVKDDERDKLDSDALLKTLTRNTEEANKERAKRGWGSFHVTNWYKPPFYDASTRNLTWAIQGYADNSDVKEASVNYSVRVLGRRGTMNVDLVLEPSLVETAVPQFKDLLQGFSFLPGNNYSEFRAGDTVAKYGLAALVVGGATAVAAKTGLIAKFWKLIVAAIASLAGLLGHAWNYFKRVLSGKASEESPRQG